MTIIQPQKNKNFYYKVFLIFSPLIVTIFVLIYIYNQTINLGYETAKTKAEINNIQAANAELKDEIFRLFDSQNVKDFAKNNNLIVESSPQYLEVSSKWAFASRY